MKKENDNPIRNASGCFDFTAHDAIERVDYAMERERVKRSIDTIRLISELCGFKIEGRIILRDIKTGKVWR